MGFQDAIYSYSIGGYQRLQSEVNDTSDPTIDRCPRKRDGRVITLRLSSRRLKSCCISTVSLPRRIVELCGEIINTIKLKGMVCPTMILSSHWGLPVLPHPAVSSKNMLVCK